jgi:hypothetical protein
VLLFPPRPGLNAGRYVLVVNGTSADGISDLYGLLLDGEGTGHPGSDFTTILDVT